MTTSRLLQQTGLALASLGLVLALSACDPGEPDPTSDTTTSTQTTTEPPTTDPTTTQDYQQTQIAAATEFLTNYYADISALGNDGYTDWQLRIQPYFLGSPLWEDEVAPLYEYLESEGITTEGEIVVTAIAASNWVEDPTDEGYDTVSFTVCEDPRALVYLDADGQPMEGDIQPPDHLFPTTYELIGQPGNTDYGWSIMERTIDSDATC